MANKALITQFVEVADGLAIWKLYPSGKDRGVLAVNLMEWCDSKIERARWLLEQVDQFDEYPGPKTLSTMIRDHFKPTGPLAKYESIDPEKPEPISKSVLSLLPEDVRKKLQ